jgi:2-dehydropantoate 2-reductase
MPSSGPRFAVYGAGALGCYLAAVLERAGYPVALIARGRHLEAIARDGIHVEGPEGAFRATPHAVVERPAEVPPVDGILLTVKAWQVPEAAQAVRPMLGPETRVLPLQNGVEAADQIAAALGKRHTLLGLCRIVCLLTGPGHVRHVAVEPTVALGELSRHDLSASARELAAALEAAGVTVSRPADMRAATWEKLLLIAGLSGIGAVSRSPVGEIRGHASTRALLVQLMNEVLLVATARGIRLGDDVLPRTLAFVDAMAPVSTSSMQRDIADAKPSELEAIVGVIVRMGEEAGVATPVARFVYGSLAPQELRARRASAESPEGVS